MSDNIAQERRNLLRKLVERVAKWVEAHKKESCMSAGAVAGGLVAWLISIGAPVIPNSVAAGILSTTGLVIGTVGGVCITVAAGVLVGIGVGYMVYYLHVHYFFD